VNTGDEAQKSGSRKDTVAFVRHCRDTLELPVVGLMCIPPLGDQAAFISRCSRSWRASPASLLSMGMRRDFERTIRFGATHVRMRHRDLRRANK